MPANQHCAGVALLILAFLPAPSVLLAQAGSPPPAKEDLGSVEGKVVNALTGEPLADARITLVDSAAPAIVDAVSGEGGRYEAKNLRPGSYSPMPQKSGFVAGAFGAKWSGRGWSRVVVTRGQHLTDVDIPMTPHGVIAGRVVNSDGNPVSGALVYALRPQYEDGVKRLVEAGWRLTDDLGEYRFWGLNPGGYYISAERRPAITGEDRSAKSPADGYVTTFYPGVREAESAAKVDALPGKPEQGVNIKLARASLTRIRGRVLNQTGAPGAISLDLRRGDREGSVSATIAAAPDGRFEFRGIAPGTYRLVARVGAASGSEPQSARTIEVRGEPIEGVALALIPRFDASGTVRLEDGAKPGSLQIAALPLPPADPSSRQRSMLLTRARPDGGGAFTMKGLSPDRYRLSVTGIPEGCYLASAKIGEMDVLTDGMDLSGGPPGALELVLKGNAGRVSGLVKDGNGGPVPGARVALVPNDRQSLRLYRTATVDQYGRFNFASVPPGKYKLFAFDSVEEGAWMDPDFLRTVESKGAAVTVREGGAEVRELEAIP